MHKIDSYQLLDNIPSQLVPQIKQKTQQFFSQIQKSLKKDTETLSYIHPYLKAINQQSFPLNNCNQPQIIFYIKNISFKYLTKLDLRYNLITSIEFLYSIQMPLLSNLQLDDNCIATIKTLRKGQFNLRQLKISNNYINELDYLSECKYSLDQFAIQYLPDRYMINSLNFVLKLQSNKIQTLRALNKQRITQKNVQRHICQKNQKIDLRTYVRVR